ncbi:hypothetical protein BD408DRAFT_415967 [Parasitella parasitica]|nr:hypothetical protein BD408DRAFT_415967 [Parasitella parasitica]
MSIPSKTDAKTDQFIGNVKEKVGYAVGNERLRGEGKAQNGQGQVEEQAATTLGYVQGLTTQVTGAVQDAVNSLVGNNSGQASAKVEQKKGEAQKEMNS